MNMFGKIDVCCTQYSLNLFCTTHLFGLVLKMYHMFERFIVKISENYEIFIKFKFLIDA